MSEKQQNASLSSFTTGPSASDQASVSEGSHADFLVRSALDFVTQVYPIADVQVSYRERDEETKRPASRAEPGDRSDACRDVRPVPGHPEVLRVVDITLNEQVSRFWKTEAEGVYLDHACRRITSAVDRAGAWAGQLGTLDDPDTREVFEAALPTRLVARLTAEQLAQERRQGKDEGDEKERSGGFSEADIEELSTTLARSLKYMDDLARSRVEHQELSHGVVVAPRVEDDRVEGDPAASGTPRYPRDYRRLKRTPLLSDGYQAALRVAPDGQPLDLLKKTDVSAATESPAPHEFGEFTFLAAASRKYVGVGLMLRPGGSIVLFADGRPLFIRRAGQWRGMIWDIVRGMMVERYGEVGTRVFDAALLLTTSGRGGILAVMDDGAPEGIQDKDRVDRAHENARPGEAPGDSYGQVRRDETRNETRDAPRATPDEWLFHDLLPKEGLAAITPPTLALLASIDGATLVSQGGTLLAYGAIVPSHQSESEGARTAAARTLSSDGLVLKISEDGPIELFESGNHILTI